jgi:hypothetical protein
VTPGSAAARPVPRTEPWPFGRDAKCDPRYQCVGGLHRRGCAGALGVVGVVAGCVEVVVVGAVAAVVIVPLELVGAAPVLASGVLVGVIVGMVSAVVGVVVVPAVIGPWAFGM